MGETILIHIKCMYKNSNVHTSYIFISLYMCMRVCMYKNTEIRINLSAKSCIEYLPPGFSNGANNMLPISWLYSGSPGWFNVRKTCWRYYRTTWKVISLYLQDQNMLMREPTVLGHTLDDYSPLSQFPNSSVEKEKRMDFMISFGGYLTERKTCILGHSFVGSWIFHIHVSC